MQAGGWQETVYVFAACTCVSLSKYPLCWWYWSVSSCSLALFSPSLCKYMPNMSVLLKPETLMGFICSYPWSLVSSQIHLNSHGTGIQTMCRLFPLGYPILISTLKLLKIKPIFTIISAYPNYERYNSSFLSYVLLYVTESVLKSSMSSLRRLPPSPYWFSFLETSHHASPPLQFLPCSCILRRRWRLTSLEEYRNTTRNKKESQDFCVLYKQWLLTLA